MTDEVIEFVRKKDLIFVEELGQGACGRTLILRDEMIDENFVCKKYSPIDDSLKEEWFLKFVSEIKILHLLFHPNIVRVFNYYLYPEIHAGFILMELVRGSDIEDYLKKNPQKINDIFIQTIDGFKYLEKHEILHRDIRPGNILVSDKGIVKIIDFGFGKRVNTSKDFDKSITLNWWCTPPNEFANQTYNYSTEVYFVGKLFEKILLEAEIEHFAYRGLLSQMCSLDPLGRIKTFAKVEQKIHSGMLTDITFNENELSIYRVFANQITEAINKIEDSAKYYDDLVIVEKRLEEAYSNVMLEEYVPGNNHVLRCFINGQYYYSRNSVFEVTCFRQFIELLRSCSRDKKVIVLSNIHTRLDSIERYSEAPVDDGFDDIPF